MGKGEDDGFVDSDIERDEEPEEKKAELDGSEDPTDAPTTTLSVAASPQLSALMSWLPGEQRCTRAICPISHPPFPLHHFPVPFIRLLENVPCGSWWSCRFHAPALHPIPTVSVSSSRSRSLAARPLAPLFSFTRLAWFVVPCLAESVSLCDWTLVYSTQVHARNLSAFYSKAKLIGPTLMLLQTQVRRSGEETALGPSASPVFGFYCSKSMAPTSKRAPNWVGSLDSFLFQVGSWEP